MSGHPTFAAIWWLLISAFAVVRLAVLNLGPKHLGQRCESLLLILTLVASGFLWSAPLTVIGPEMTAGSRYGVVLLVAILCAISAIAFSAVPLFAFSFAVPALIILCGFFMAQGEGVVISIATTLAVLVLVSGAVRRMGSKLDESFLNEAALIRQTEELTKRQERLSEEVSARVRSEMRLNGALASARSFQATLEELFEESFARQSASSDLFRKSCEKVARALRVRRVSIWLLEENGARLHCLNLFDRELGAHDSGVDLYRVDHAAYFRALDQERAIVADDVFSHPATADFSDDYLKPIGIVSMLDAPIRGAEAARGVICCESVNERRDWTPDEVNFVAAVGQLLSLRILADDAQGLNDDLAAALQEAKAANAAKSTFLATMSHEIRTPMNGILGAADILKDMSLTPEMRKFTTLINASGESLMMILNDILDLSKIEVGKLDLEEESFDLAALIDRVAAVHSMRAREKGVRIETVFKSQLKDRVGDQHRLTQVLHNLTSNAVKFSTDGDVTISVEDDNDGVVIAVADSGVGMDAEAAARVFKPFQQADSSTTRKHGGTGLGLAIVRGIVDAMQGRIELKTKPGEGSTFRLHLPLPQADEPTEDSRREVSRSQRGDFARTAIRALVAEDNETNRLIMDAFLKRAGVEAVYAVNGKEAVDAFEVGGFDVVLMDIQMPELDGVGAFDAIRAIDEQAGGRNTPIIAVTANAMAHEVKSYLTHGFDGHLPKPITEAGLDDILVAALTARAADAA